MTEPPAEVSVVALLAGDEGAFVELVERHGPVLLRLALANSPSRALAEEAVQETWLAVLRSLHQFDGRSSLRTWMCRIVINVARRRAGQEARSTPVSSWSDGGTSGPTVDPARFQRDGPWAGHWASLPLDPSVLPEERLFGLEVRARIAQAVAGLAQRQREVFLLRDVEGWAGDEVCAALEITPGHQRVLLHRARAALRERLEEVLADQL